MNSELCGPTIYLYGRPIPLLNHLLQPSDPRGMKKFMLSDRNAYTGKIIAYFRLQIELSITSKTKTAC